MSGEGPAVDERLEDDLSSSSSTPPTLFKKKGLAMSTKFKGELGLLKSLNQLELQRSERAVKYKADNPGLSLIATADKAKLESFRVVSGAAEKHQQTVEKEAVLALPHTDPTIHSRRAETLRASDKPSERLQRLHHKRLERHRSTVAKFEEDKSALAQKIEISVRNEAMQMKCQLQEIEQCVEQKFVDLGNGSHLASHTMVHIKQAWTNLESECKRHRKIIEEFGEYLSTIETERAATFGARVQTLAFNLVNIAHMLPDAIERFVEQQTEPVNLVVLRNARAYAVTMARLRKKDVAFFVATRSRHRELVRTWRQLRHDEVVRNFNTRLDSDEFTGPSDRAALLDEAQSTRKSRHTKSRLKILKRLRSLVPPILDTTAINDVKNKFKELNKEEEAWFHEFTGKLGHSNARNAQKALDLLEAARVELHDYCALAPEGDLLARQRNLSQLVDTPEMEEQLRSAGNMKKELNSLEDALGQRSETAYQEPLAKLQTRVKAITSGFGINEVLDAQGKLADKKDLIATLENMRVAKPASLPAMVPLLKMQLEALLSLGPELLHEEVFSVLQQTLTNLDEVITEMAKIQGSSYEDTENLKQSGSVARTVRTKRTARTEKSSSTRRTRGSRSSGISGGSSSLSADTVAKVRHVQRTVAMLFSADDLPSTLKTELQGIQSDLAMQHKANELIDADLETRCSMVILHRDKEAVVFLEVISDAVSRQIEALDVACSRITQFYFAVAKDLEAHTQAHEEIDEKMAEDLEDCKLDFEDAAEVRENEVTETTKRLRAAPSLEDLEHLYTQALTQLENIELSYRAYFKDATTMAKLHPVQASDEAQNAIMFFSHHFHLIPLNEFDQALISRQELEVRREERLRQREAQIEAERIAAQEAEEAAGKKKGKKDSAADSKEVVDKSGEVEVTTDKSTTSHLDTDEEEIVDNIDPATGEPRPLPLDVRIQHIRRSWIRAVPFSPSSIAEDAEEKASTQDVELDTLEFEFMPFKVLKSLGDFAQELVTVIDEDELEAARQEAELKLKREKEEEEKFREKEPNQKEQEHEDESEVQVEQKLNQAEANDVEQENADNEETDAQEIMEADTEAKKDIYEPTFKAKDYVEQLEIPSALLEGMMKKLQEKLFTKLLKDDRTWQKQCDDLLRERVEDLTDELEERLRQHWPRKGRTEVDQQQPRIAELNAHKEKLMRHVRVIAKRNSVHNDQHAAVVKEGRDHVNEYSASMQKLQAKLSLAASLAALQGLLTKAKKLTDEFDMECRALDNKMRPYILTQPATLAQSNINYMKVCATFDNGGDYNPGELQSIQEILNESTADVQASVEDRKLQSQDLDQSRADARGALDTFSGQYQSCLKELSMSKGIGQKYGAPRRNAQERLRSLVTQSDAEAGGMEEDLHELVELLKQQPGIAPNSLSRPILTSITRKRGQRTPTKPRVPSLSESIQRCIFRLQLRLHRRGVFLQQLLPNACVNVSSLEAKHDHHSHDHSQGEKNDMNMESCLPMELHDVISFIDEVYIKNDTQDTEDKVDGVKQVVDTKEEDPDSFPPLKRLNFMTQVMASCSSCEDETRALYKKEGLELEDGKVPMALQKWLNSQRAWAKDQRLKAADDFKRQIQWFRALLPQLADHAMEDVRARFSNAMSRKTSKLARSLNRRLVLWEEVKANHQVALKPRLASVNQAEELKVLIEKETSRSMEVTQAVTATEKKVVAVLKEYADRFKQAIVHNAKCLLLLLDACLDAEDCKPLRREDLDILTTERAWGMDKESANYADVVAEIQRQLGEHGALTLKERPLDELRKNVSGVLLRAAPGQEGVKNGIFEVGQQVEVKRQLSSPYSMPSYTPGEQVQIHQVTLISNIPSSVNLGSKSKPAVFEVVAYNKQQALVNLRSNSGTCFNVPEQMVIGANDVFVPGVLVSKERINLMSGSPSRRASMDKQHSVNPGVCFAYSIEFEKAHSSLRRLRRKERRAGREEEPDMRNESGNDGIRPLQPRVRRQRTWQGLDLSKLCVPDDVLALLEDSVAVADAQLNNDIAKMKGKDQKKKKEKKKGKKGKRDGDKDEDVDDDDVLDGKQTKGNSPDLRSLLMPPQRSLVRGRDKHFDTFVQLFGETLEEKRANYRKLEKEEEAWRVNWAKMIEILKTSGDSTAHE